MYQILRIQNSLLTFCSKMVSNTNRICRSISCLKSRILSPTSIIKDNNIVVRTGIRNIQRNTIHTHSLPLSHSTVFVTARTSIQNDTNRRFYHKSNVDNASSKCSDTNNTPNPIENELHEYLSSLGYHDPQLQKGILTSLHSAMPGTKLSPSLLQSTFGTEGIKALAKSVQQELQSQIDSANNVRENVLLHVEVPHHNLKFDVNIPDGENFMSYIMNSSIATTTTPTTNDNSNIASAELLQEYLEYSCQGTMSCSTCHIILDSDSFQKLQQPTSMSKLTEAEQDTLDLAYDPQPTSRLGCQIVVTKDLEGMTVTIPSGVNNLWS